MADLSNFNARVRGLRGRLLKRPDYEPLFGAEDLDDYAERLRGTGYGPYMDVAKARYGSNGTAIEAALVSSLSGAFELMVNVAPKDAARFLKALFAGWEVYGIKTIIRGIARGTKREEILELLMPAGELDRAAIKNLLTSKDVEDAVAFIETWGSPYAAPLKDGLAEYKKNGSLSRMEVNLDFFLYGRLAGTGKARGLDERILSDVFRLRIDIRNIMTLIKLAGEGYAKEAAAGFFMEGGAGLQKDDFERMGLYRKRDELISALAAAFARGPIGAALSMADADDMNQLEERFEEIIEGRLRRLAIVEPLSIALCASYVLMLAREVKNLRLIGRAKAFSIPVEEIKRSIIYPL